MSNQRDWLPAAIFNSFHFTQVQPGFSQRLKQCSFGIMYETKKTDDSDDVCLVFFILAENTVVLTQQLS